MAWRTGILAGLWSLTQTLPAVGQDESRAQAARSETTKKATIPPDRAVRPQSVPVTAFWVGGSDGGVYIVLIRMKARDRERYCAKVFDDFTGTIRFSGVVSRYPTNAKRLEGNPRLVVVGWDGSGILLRDGTALRP